MKIIKPIYEKQGDFWRVIRWEVVGEVPAHLSGAAAIEWAKERGHFAPILED